MMDKFDYKVLLNKRAGLLTVNWFDGSQDLGPKITSELLSSYGQDGWEVVTAMQTFGGLTHKLILQRRRPANLRG
jgi:hypothetical protein